MSTLKKSPIPAEKIALYEKLSSRFLGLKGKVPTIPTLPLRQYVFAAPEHDREDGPRLSTDERDQFLKKYKTTLFEAYGAVMKEYVAVPDALLRNTTELQKYLALSYAYVKTLKPETAKKKH